MRRNHFKLRGERFKLDIRRKFFPQSVMRQCNRLPREAVGATPLEGIRIRLDGGLGSLI